VGSEDSRPNFNMVFRSDALAERIPHRRAIHYWVLNPKRPGVVGPLDLGGQWWCIAMGVDHERTKVDPPALVRSLLGDESSNLPVEVIATDPWRARMQLTDRYGSGRVFLAGDAAHLNPPWGGHGFNTGIGDAVNIGWKLAAVIHGWASAALLETYELERRPVAEDTIAVASKNMATLSPELSDERLMGSAAEFAAVHPRVEAIVQRTKYGEFHSLGLVLGTSYRSSPIVASEPGDEALASFEGDEFEPSATPGSRLPHHWLRSDLSLYDVIGPGYSLVGDLTVFGAAVIVDEAARLGIPLTTVVLSSAVSQQLFEAPLVLVRPDQHVAWRGTEPRAVRQLLLRVTGHR
jgi:hypothetical protein